MAIRCTGIEMSKGGYHHEHIVQIQYIDTDGVTKWCTRAQMVEYIESGGQAYVRDARGDVAYLAARKSAYGNKYVQTYADGIWQDNLLALPRY